MKKLLTSALTCTIFALTACGGGGSSSSLPVGGGSPTSPQSIGSASVTLRFPVPAGSSAKARKPEYVSPATAQVVVTINTVNGGVPASDVTPNPQTIALTTGGSTPNCVITGSTETCTLAVLAPVGSVKYTFTLEDSSGSPLSSGSATFTIVQGQANNGLTVTLDGIASSVAFGAVTPVSANVTVSGQIVALNVKDADSNPITGSAPYTTPFTVTDSDTSGATSLQVNGGTTSTSVTIAAPTDVLTLSYSGLAIPAFTLNASSTGGGSASATVTPTLFPATFTGSNVALDDSAHGGLITDPNYNQETLFFTNATTSESFTPAELGYTNAPYGKSLSVLTGACGGTGIIGSIGGSGGVYTVPPLAAGVCSIDIVDGAGQITKLWISVTTANIGLQ